MTKIKVYYLGVFLMAAFASCQEKESTPAPTTGAPQELPCTITSGMKLTNHNTNGSGVD